MGDAQLYITLGFWHILDASAYDHIVFIAAFCVAYVLADWRKLVYLVTAFTIGHSITLALSVTNLLVFPAVFIETLIPITIMLTSLLNIRHSYNVNDKMRYILLLFFGFIHGAGFSSYLKSIIGEGQSVLLPLFYFNIGIEIAQIIVLSAMLLLMYLFLKLFHVEQSIWKTFVSGASFGIALTLLLNILLA